MPLPVGWSSVLTNYWIDNGHVPPLWWGEVTFTEDASGRSFKAVGSIPADQVVGMTAQQVITMVWPQYANYVLSAIADKGLAPPPAPVAPIPVVIP